MAEGCWYQRGGIFGLLELHERHPGALERDLIVLGLRWRDVGTEAFTWRDLLVIVENSAADSAIARAMYPNEVAWGVTDYLLAAAVDALAVGNWQRDRANGGKSRKPKPVQRPRVRKPGEKRRKAIPLDQMKAHLGWD